MLPLTTWFLAVKLNSQVKVGLSECTHWSPVVGDLGTRDLDLVKCVNSVTGNLKTSLAGAFHPLKYSKYASHYLAAVAYKFNRRFDLRALMGRLIVDVWRCWPIMATSIEARSDRCSSPGTILKTAVLITKSSHFSPYTDSAVAGLKC